jgi:hypothetical protein
MIKLFCESCVIPLVGIYDRLHNVMTCPNCHYRIRAVGTIQ